MKTIPTKSALAAFALGMMLTLGLSSCAPTEVSVSSVSVSPTSMELTVGQSQAINASVSPATATNKDISWTSSNSSVATVSGGKVTAVAPGSATITASAEGGKSASCQVTVKAKAVPVESVSLDKTTLEVEINSTGKLTATVLPADATNKEVTWESSDPAVATVSGGTVKAVTEGTCTVSVKTMDGGHTATCTVTVKPQAPIFPDEEYFKTYYWDRTDRERDGFRGKVKSHHITKYTTYHLYTYDERGNLIEDRYVNTQNESSTTIITHTYDSENHRLTSETRYPASDNFLATRIVYQYENKGRYVPTTGDNWGHGIFVSGSGIPLTIYKDLSLIALYHDLLDHLQCHMYKYEFISDTELKVTFEYFWLPPGSDIFDKTLRTNEETGSVTVYYKDGLPYKSNYVKEVEYYANGMFKSYPGDEGIYSFPENDHVNSFNEYQATVTPGGMLPVWWTKVTYNENMDKTDEEECAVAANMTFHDTWRSYKYDSHGNWISRVETVTPRWFGEATPDVIEREITYY